jgi:hypothetical protein
MAIKGDYWLIAIQDGPSASIPIMGQLTGLNNGETRFVEYGLYGEDLMSVFASVKTFLVDRHAASKYKKAMTTWLNNRQRVNQTIRNHDGQVIDQPQLPGITTVSFEVPKEGAAAIKNELVELGCVEANNDFATERPSIADNR